MGCNLDMYYRVEMGKDVITYAMDTYQPHW